jgi:hypothetical protein
MREVIWGEDEENPEGVDADTPRRDASWTRVERPAAIVLPQLTQQLYPELDGALAGCLQTKTTIIQIYFLEDPVTVIRY